MIRVTFQGNNFQCERAVKGANYIRLYNENNIQTTAFEEVADFSAFTIEGGEWEAGKSTQRVAAQATVNENSFVLQIKEKVIVEDGLIISFDAPSNSENITTITIDSADYYFFNAENTAIADAPDSFDSGAKLEIVLSISENSRIAYLQNAAVSEVDKKVDKGEGFYECYVEGGQLSISVSSFNVLCAPDSSFWYQGIRYPINERSMAPSTIISPKQGSNGWADVVYFVFDKSTKSFKDIAAEYFDEENHIKLVIAVFDWSTGTPAITSATVETFQPTKNPNNVPDMTNVINDYRTRTINPSQIGANTITSDMIWNGAVTGAKVNTSQIATITTGTWTPSISGSTTIPTAYYGAQSGQYCKIGRMVYLTGVIGGSFNNGAGNIILKSLPFTPTSTTNVFAVDSSSITNTLTNYKNLKFHSVLSGGFALYGEDSNGQLQPITWEILSSLSSIYIKLIYITNS